MYVKPSANRYGMKLPENYSGNAFSNQSPYSEMPPPARMPTQRQDMTIPDVPMRDIPTEEYHQEFVSPHFPREAEEESYDASHDEHYDESFAEPRQKTQNMPASPSIFSSLLPKGGLSTHFPFGHGIGSEELLILAVMLMVFLSGNETGEVDSEFILLLGLLLFAG